MKDLLKITVTFPSTGRSAPWVDQATGFQARDVETEIIKFIETGDPEQINDLLGCAIKNFNSEYKGVAELTFYRGVELAKVEAKRFGPPPSGLQSSSRYNKSDNSDPGQRTLYTASSPQAVLCELKQDKCKMQEFKFVKEMKIADLTSSNSTLDDKLRVAFLFAERGKPLMSERDSLVDERRYVLSQWLADQFRACHWDALLVPGVQGNSDFQYNNLCVFHPKSDDWLIYTHIDSYEYPQAQEISSS